MTTLAALSLKEKEHDYQTVGPATKEAVGGDSSMPPTSEEYMDDTLGTPTPSEKVSRWHRDIFLVSPDSNGDNNNNNNGGGITKDHKDRALSSSSAVPAATKQQVHPRQCICDACMAEYGTFKIYNQMMQEKKEPAAADKDRDRARSGADGGASNNTKKKLQQKAKNVARAAAKNATSNDITASSPVRRLSAVN